MRFEDIAALPFVHGIPGGQFKRIHLVRPPLRRPKEKKLICDFPIC